jgi:3-oxoacyl-[acyl-carrier-protein] synthase II
VTVMPDAPDVVITGLGLVLPHGVGLKAADAVFEGRSAVARLDSMAGIPDATGAAVQHFLPPAGTEDADRAIQFAVAAAEEAWAGSGLSSAGIQPDRVATILSLSKGAVHTLTRMAGRQREPQNLFAGSTPDAAAHAVAARLRLAGPAAAPLTACASGGHALVWGATLVERGVVDAALVGASEASLHPLIYGSYRRMGVLAAAGDDPAASVRPFSATRRGFAIGEGAGVLVLESAESAARRGARPLAAVRGWAAGCHARDLVDMESDGAGLARLMVDAMRRARVRPADVDYVHAHGTATRYNDLAEARAIRAALGDAAAGVSVSSTKGSHGHLLGAATAVELVITVMAMTLNLVPPTANLTDPDPAIGLDCTPLRARARPIRCALKIASGFGGQMVAIVLGAPTVAPAGPRRHVAPEPAAEAAGDVRQRKSAET